MKKKKLACLLLAVWMGALTAVSVMSPAAAAENSVSQETDSAYEETASADIGEEEEIRPGREALSVEASSAEEPLPGSEAEGTGDIVEQSSGESGSRNVDTAGSERTGAKPEAQNPEEASEKASDEAERPPEENLAEKKAVSEMTEAEICAFAAALLEHSDLEGGAGPGLDSKEDIAIWQRYLTLLDEESAASSRRIRRAPSGGRYPSSVVLRDYLAEQGYQAKIGFLTTADYDDGKTVHGGAYNYDRGTGRTLYCVDQHWDGALGNRTENSAEEEEASDLGGTRENRILFSYILSHGLGTAGERATDSAYRSTVGNTLGASCLDYAITQAALWDVLAGQTRKGYSPGKGNPRRGFDIEAGQVGARVGNGCESIGWTDAAVQDAWKKAVKLADDARAYLKAYPEGEKPSVTLSPIENTQLTYQQESRTFTSGWIGIRYGGTPFDTEITAAEGSGEVIWDENGTRFRVRVPASAVTGNAVTVTASAKFRLYDSMNYRWRDQAVQRFALLVGPSETSDDDALNLTVPVQKVSLKKRSSDAGLTAENACYTLSGAEYGIYRTAEEAEGDTDRICTLVTDDRGETKTVELPPGLYYVKEQKASEGFQIDPAVQKLELSQEEPSAVKTLTVREEPVTAEFMAAVRKTDRDLFERCGTAGPQGNQLLQGAVIRVSYYDNTEDRYEGTPVRSWYFETDADGRIRPASDETAAGYESSAFFTNAAGSRIFPIGTYALEEIKASSGFRINQGVFLHGVIKQTEPGSDTAAFMVHPETNPAGMVETDAEEALHYYLKQVNPVRIGICLQKRDRDTGTAEAQGDVPDLSGIRYRVKNRSAHTILYAGEVYQPGETFSLVTGRDGTVSTGAVLPVGTYEIREEVSGGENTGYLRDDPTVHILDIQADGENGFAVKQDGVRTGYAAEELDGKVFTFSFRNTVKKGGVKVLKYDAERNSARPQGAGSLAEAVICVVNASDHAVWIRDNGAEGVTYCTGLIPTAKELLGSNPDRAALEKAGESVVLTMKTNPDGRAQSGPRDLPYGTYFLYEASSSKGYEVNPDWIVRCEVREDGTHYRFDQIHGDARTRSAEPAPAGGEALPESVRRYELQLIKLDMAGEAKLYIPFLIQRLKTDAEGNVIYEDGEPVTLEQHVAVTDADGTIDTRTRRKPSGEERAELDGMVQNGVFADSGKLSGYSGLGVWFGESDPEEGRGSLLYGKYRVVEISCEENRNKGENLTVSDIFTAEAEEDTGRHTCTVCLVDRHIDVTSEACAENSVSPKYRPHTVSVGENVPVTETLHLTNLDVGRTYYVYTRVTDSEDRTRVLAANDKKWYETGTEPGGTLTREEAARLTRLTAPAQGASGSRAVEAEVTVSLLLDTTALCGKTLYVEDVVYEEIGGNIVAVSSHNRDTAAAADARAGGRGKSYEDAYRASQVLYVPEASGTAMGSPAVRTGDRGPGRYLCLLVAGVTGSVCSLHVRRKKRNSRSS